MRGMNENERLMVEKHHDLIYEFLSLNDLQVEDYYGNAAIGLCQAAMSYRKEISTFSKYAFVCMAKATGTACTEGSKSADNSGDRSVYYFTEIEDGTCLYFDESSLINDGIEDDILFHAYLESLINQLSEKEKTVFKMCASGYRQKEIADVLGYSQSHISRIASSIRNRIER